MLLLYLLIWLVQILHSDSSCAYLSMKGIGYPLDTCFKYSDARDSFDMSYKYKCANKKSSTVGMEFYHTEDCSDEVLLEQNDLYCTNIVDKLNGNLCECFGTGSSCDTIDISIGSNGENKCDMSMTDGYFGDTAMVANECIPDGKGGSMILGCDHSALIYKYYPECEGCDCVSEYSEMEYSYLNNECININCNIKSKDNSIKDKSKTCRSSEENLVFLKNHLISNHHNFAQSMMKKHGYGYVKPNNYAFRFHIAEPWLYFIWIVLVLIGLIAFTASSWYLCREHKKNVNA